MPHHRDSLSAAYGFGLFALPTYRPASRGDWRVSTHMPSVGDGYLSTLAIEARAVLTRGREVWMSTGLLEQESHAWHVHCARGTVVALGLGMGMYVYAAAMKQSVHPLIAADISSDIIAVMQEATGFDNWPCRDKITIIEADALDPDFDSRVAQCTGGEPIDYLYADLWPTFPAAEAPTQTAEIADALRPRAAGRWGQELSFARYCRRTKCVANEGTLRTYFAESGIPAPPITPGYAAFCRDVMKTYHIAETKPAWRPMRNLFRCKRSGEAT